MEVLLWTSWPLRLSAAGPLFSLVELFVPRASLVAAVVVAAAAAVVVVVAAVVVGVVVAAASQVVHQILKNKNKIIKYIPILVLKYIKFENLPPELAPHTIGVL